MSMNSSQAQQLLVNLDQVIQTLIPCLESQRINKAASTARLLEVIQRRADVGQKLVGLIEAVRKEIEKGQKDGTTMRLMGKEVERVKDQLKLRPKAAESATAGHSLPALGDAGVGTASAAATAAEATHARPAGPNLDLVDAPAPDDLPPPSRSESPSKPSPSIETNPQAGPSKPRRGQTAKAPAARDFETLKAEALREKKTFWVRNEAEQEAWDKELATRQSKYTHWKDPGPVTSRRSDCKTAAEERVGEGLPYRQLRARVTKIVKKWLDPSPNVPYQDVLWDHACEVLLQDKANSIIDGSENNWLVEGLLSSAHKGQHDNLPKSQRAQSPPPPPPSQPSTSKQPPPPPTPSSSSAPIKRQQPRRHRPPTPGPGGHRSGKAASSGTKVFSHIEVPPLDSDDDAYADLEPNDLVGTMEERRLRRLERLEQGTVRWPEAEDSDAPASTAPPMPRQPATGTHRGQFVEGPRARAPDDGQETPDSDFSQFSHWDDDMERRDGDLVPVPASTRPHGRARPHGRRPSAGMLSEEFISDEAEEELEDWHADFTAGRGSAGPNVSAPAPAPASASASAAPLKPADISESSDDDALAFPPQWND